MSELFLGKYRIKSIRKSGHDYTSPGAYFITINTGARIQWFGSIKNKIMKLSPIGEVVREEWLKSEIVRENIQLDEWIIMPDHIHGIIVIETARRVISNKTQPQPIVLETACQAVSKTQHQPIKTAQRTVSIKINQPRKSILEPNSIGSIIGQFKSICTKRIREKGYKHFHWQDRYYDHIVRDETDLHRIRAYIKQNPKKWQKG